jgi:GxxExxY protein
VPDNDPLTGKIIECGIEVHRTLGPGLLETAYEECLAFELERAGLSVERQVTLPVHYKGVDLDCGYRVDLMVNKNVILELKSVSKLLPIHEAQLLTYLKLANIKFGLLINFNVPLLKDGIKRMAN